MASRRDQSFRDTVRACGAETHPGDGHASPWTYGSSDARCDTMAVRSRGHEWSLMSAHPDVIRREHRQREHRANRGPHSYPTRVRMLRRGKSTVDLDPRIGGADGCIVVMSASSGQDKSSPRRIYSERGEVLLGAGTPLNRSSLSACARAASSPCSCRMASGDDIEPDDIVSEELRASHGDPPVARVRRHRVDGAWQQG